METGILFRKNPRVQSIKGGTLDEDKTNRNTDPNALGRASFRGDDRSFGRPGDRSRGPRPAGACGRPPGCPSARPWGRQHGNDPHEPGTGQFRAGRFGRRRHPGQDHFPGRPVGNHRTKAFGDRHTAWRHGFGHGHGTNPGPAATAGAWHSSATATWRTGSPSRTLTFPRHGRPFPSGVRFPPLLFLSPPFPVP